MKPLMHDARLPISKVCSKHSAFSTTGIFQRQATALTMRLSVYALLLVATALVVAETDFEFVMQFTGSCSTAGSSESCGAKGNSQVK